MKPLLLLASHLAAIALGGVLGFALGIYALPILIAPPAPAAAEVAAQAASARYAGEFRRRLKGGVLCTGARARCLWATRASL